MDDFYTARSSTKPPLPWTNFAPPFSTGTVYMGNFLLRAKEQGTTLIAPDSITSKEMVANTLTSNEINVGELVGSSAFLNQLVVDTAQINNGAIKRAQIGNLEVDTIKIAGNAVSTMEYAFNAGAKSEGGRPVMQTLSYTVGRPGPQVLDLFMELGGSALSSGEYNIRVHRDNSVVIFRETVRNISAGNVYEFSARVIDPSNISGSPTYRVDITNTDNTNSQSRAQNRYLGVLNVYK